MPIQSSRKFEALREQPLETKHLKACFRVANLEDSVDWGWSGLVGLRPQIIPQLRAKDIYPKNYEIDRDGKFRFTIKPPIVIVSRTYKGNKGNITFMVFVPTQLAERIEMLLNANGKVTPKTKLSTSQNARAHRKVHYFFERFSLRFFLLSALSFLVIGFFLEPFPIPKSITISK